MGDDTESELMKWGRLVERPMLEAFTEETGYPAEVDGNMYQQQLPELSFMQATIDGVATVGAEKAIVECKLAFWSADAWDDGVPEHVQIQVQHQLATLGYPFAFVLALLGGYKFRWARVERDDDFIDNILVPTEREFWDKVQSGASVRPSGAPDREAAAIAAMFPDPTIGKEVRLEGSSWIECFDNWRGAAAAKTVVDKKAKQFRNDFTAAMGDAEFAVLDNGQRVSLKQQTRQAHEVRASSFRVLRPVK
jgi:predicted phage-related endonuclease